MTSATAVQGAFAHSWQVQLLTAPPLIAPARQLTYPRHVPGEEDAMARGALLLQVKPAVGPAFLATCALGFRSPSVPTGIWSCPRPEQICAVAGGYAYLVDTAAPDECTFLSLRPVTAVLPLEAFGLLLFAGFHHLIAWGADGLLWQTDRLSWEGITLGEVHDGQLHGTGWHLHSDRELPFTVDLATGHHQGGGFLP